MHKLTTLTFAAATLLSASAAFAQTPVTGSMESAPMKGSTMPDAGNGMSSSGDQVNQPMNATDTANMNARAPAAMDARGNAYDSSLPADRSTTSGMSGTAGGYASGSAQYGNGYDNRYGGASMDTLNGSGHYADTARGSQLNVNDVHATPQPGALNNQLYRGN